MKSEGTSFWGGFVICFLAYVLFGFADAAIHSKFRYSIQYSTDVEHVQKELRPIDCDFFSAPIGEKGCHYDVQATTYTVPAVILSRDTKTNRPIWSDDGGKTWNWNDDGAVKAQQASTAVNVSYTKVAE